jgi:hypothetical protein
MLKPSSSSNSTVDSQGVSARSIRTVSFVTTQQQQHQQQWQEQDKWNMVSALLLSSAFATLGFATATTSSPGAGAVSTGKTATTAKAKFGRGGSGPGSNKPFSSTYTASSRENAEEDVRRLELESNEQPYMVRKPYRQ